MHDSRPLPLADRLIGAALAFAGLAAIVAAAVIAAPLALEPGWYTPRAVLFFASVVAAGALGGQAVSGVLQRLRG
jgi:hypothetical protein